MACLVGQDLEFSYAGRAVLRGAGLAVASGQATVLLGPSGSGKSTLLWILAGLLEPQAGRTGVAGSAEAAPGALTALDPRHDRIGMVFQQPTLWDHLTVRQHLELVLAGKAPGGSNTRRGDRRLRIDATLARMRLDALVRRRPGQLSGGERQRLAIARALVIDPQWLILDEPLAHLDGPIRAELFELLREALAGSRAGVLLATHNAREALRLADQVAVLLDGRVVQTGPADQVYRSPVNLDAAQVLGPAAELDGRARDGALTRDGQVILENLDPGVSGPVRMILRPESVQFRPAPAGPATVKRCGFAGGAYVLNIEVAGTRVDVLHASRLSPGCTGRLTLLRSP